jgi:hypothetical protein
VTLRDDLLPTVYEARGIAGELGFRQYTVDLVTGSSTGDHTGDGDVIDEVTPILESNGQSTRVRWLKDEEIAVGALPNGTIEVGPITPTFTGGGTDIAALMGDALERGETRFLRITGPKHPDGALYQVTQVKAERALRYMLQAKPVSHT